MKKILLTSALIAGFTASVSAQGIEPVTTTTPELDVTVGSQASCAGAGTTGAISFGLPLCPEFVAGVAAAIVATVIIASGDSTDGTN